MNTNKKWTIQTAFGEVVPVPLIILLLLIRKAIETELFWKAHCAMQWLIPSSGGSSKGILFTPEKRFLVLKRVKWCAIKFWLIPSRRRQHGHAQSAAPRAADAAVADGAHCREHHARNRESHLSTAPWRWQACLLTVISDAPRNSGLLLWHWEAALRNWVGWSNL